MQRFLDGFQRCDHHLYVENSHEHADGQSDVAQPARQEGQGIGRIGHRLIFLFVMLFTSVWAFQVAPSYALNWEGHSDWVGEKLLMQDFVDGVPPPIVKPVPRCEAMRQVLKRNAYEQVPLPGKNCVERK